MKHLLLLLNLFFISIIYSQQNENLDYVPTYSNCDLNQSASDKLNEIKTKTIEHIIENLDSISIKQLELSSDANFKLLINYTIDETGFIKPIFTNVTSGYDFFDLITEKIINIIPRFNTSQNKSKKSYNLFFLANLEIKNKKITSFSFSAPFDDPEIVPSFAGCQNETKKIDCFHEKMSNHIKSTQQYPKKAIRKGIMGRVETFFIIDKDGTIKNIKVKQVEGKELLEEEAIRVISLLPKMIIPGKINGKPIKIKYAQPITFKLQ
jgi:TonB family protein